jgi:hypothetical protein
MRSLGPPLVALTLLAGTALGGCGGAASPPQPAAGARVRSAPVTKAEALAYARAVNLRSSDLPGLTVKSGEGEHEEDGSAPAERAFASCSGGVRPRLRVIERASPTFSGAAPAESEQLGSVVEVMPTRALMERHNAAVHSPRGLACLKHLIPAAMALANTGRVRFGPVAITQLPNTLATPGSFATEFTLPIRGSSADLYVDALGFTAGASEVTVSAIGYPQAVPEEVEQRLLSLLYGRARAHQL